MTGMRDWKRWQPSDDATIRRMVDEGKTAVEIGAALGRTDNAIHQRMKRTGLRRDDGFRTALASAHALEIAERRRAEKAIRAGKAVAMREQGLSTAEIATETGFSYFSVLRYLREAGLPPTHRTTGLGKPKSAIAPGKPKTGNPAAKPKPQRAAAKRKPEPAAIHYTQPTPQRRKPFKVAGHPRIANVVPMGEVVRAAQRLGRFYQPVVRTDIATATERDLARPAESYRVGRLTMTAAEMVALSHEMEDRARQG